MNQRLACPSCRAAAATSSGRSVAGYAGLKFSVMPTWAAGLALRSTGTARP